MNRRRIALLSAIVVVVAVAVVASCNTVPRVAAVGSIAGYGFRGSVDSDIARDVLEGRALPNELVELRRRYQAAGEVPSREELVSLSARYSPDVATLLFIETVSARPDVEALRKRYETEVAEVRRLGVEQARPDVPDDLLILMVPGWFYISHGAETNADYRIQRRIYDAWGVKNELVPILENGTVEENARIVADAVRVASKSHRVFLVSASKSGAEVALALGRELQPGESDAVVGWLSIVGVVRGSPLVDRMFEPDLCWFMELQLGAEGFDLEGAASMASSRGRAAFDALHFPPHVRIYSFLAAPLSGEITGRGSFGYQRMRAMGPNDGLTLLADELLPQATPLLATGVDHFLGNDQELWSSAVFRVFVGEIPHERPATPAAKLER